MNIEKNGRCIKDGKCKTHAKSMRMCVYMEECIVCLQISRLFLSLICETCLLRLSNGDICNLLFFIVEDL
jgi:hypothetical protein